MTVNKLFSTKFDLPERGNEKDWMEFEKTEYPVWITVPIKQSSTSNEERAISPTMRMRSVRNKGITSRSEYYPENDDELKSIKPPSAVDTSFEDSWISDDDDDDTLTVSLYYKPPMIDDTTTQQDDHQQDISRSLLFDCDASRTDSALELVDSLKRGCKLCNQKIKGLVDILSVVSPADADETLITETQEGYGVEITLDNYKK